MRGAVRLTIPVTALPISISDADLGRFSLMLREG
jgi:hypothetical protein